MNRKQLVESIQAYVASAIPKTHVEAVLDALATTTQNAMAKGDEVTLPGIGIVAVTERKARTGRNPRTGETIAIAGKRVPRFTPAKKLKDACGGEDIATR